MLIDFGTHVVGETISRTINLTNNGALGTRFKVQASAGDSSTRRATAKSSPGNTVLKTQFELSGESAFLGITKSNTYIILLKHCYPAVGGLVPNMDFWTRMKLCG